MINSNDLTQFQGDKYINPSDLIDLRDTADAEREALVELISEAGESEASFMEIHDAERDLQLWDEENMEELVKLRKLCDDIDQDETLIRDSEIEVYLDDMVNDCYNLPKNLPSFVTLTINYDMLKQDYAEIQYGSDTYWQRCT